jgi:hypothetical protein
VDDFVVGEKIGPGDEAVFNQALKANPPLHDSTKGYRLIRTD